MFSIEDIYLPLPRFIIQSRVAGQMIIIAVEYVCISRCEKRRGNILKF